MPASRVRREPRLRKTALDRRIKAEAHAAAAARLTSWGRFKKRVGWSLCGFGMFLFGLSFVAGAAGIQVLPFDQHHVFGQLGGGVIAITGLVWATS